MKYSGIEFKTGLIFAIIAFVLSIIAGFIGSVPAGMVFFRSIIVIPLFFLVGFGALIIIKKFVPEVYEALTNFSRTAEDDEIEKADMSFNDTGEFVSENREENFTEFTEDDYDRVNSTNNKNVDNKVNTSNGKLGKHKIIEENQFNGYEPKVMAEAIRTMMSKD